MKREAHPMTLRWTVSALRGHDARVGRSSSCCRECLEDPCGALEVLVRLSAWPGGQARGTGTGTGAGGVTSSPPMCWAL